MIPSATDPLHFSSLSAIDTSLKGNTTFQSALTRFSQPAPAALVQKAADLINKQIGPCHVVENADAALKMVTTLMQAALKEHKETTPLSLYFGGSRTTEEIGLTDAYVASTFGASVQNYRTMIAAAHSQPDGAVVAAEMRRKGQGAHVFVSSVAAISAADGIILGCDATGTRIGGWCHAAKQVILVLGSNKVVADRAVAHERMESYQYHLESARCRVAYKAPTMSSTIGNVVELRAKNPWGAPRVTVIIVNGAFGY